MARHRSPKGRRAHLGPPLTASVAAAGAGAHRPVPVPQLTPSLSVRLVATVVAGGAVAAAGQHALTEALPAAADGANLLRLGVEEVLGSAPQMAAAAVPVTPTASFVTDARPAAATGAVSPVAADPVVADAADLIKAADLQRAAAEAAAADAAKAAATQHDGLLSEVGSALQMVVGRVTSGFGGRWGAVHEGIDIAAPIGTPIRVPMAGTVINAGTASGFGLWVRVRHADGTITVYGHVNRIFVKVGEKVAAGEKIAEVGNRGHSTGPHLHFEVITSGGKHINPKPWLDQHDILY